MEARRVMAMKNLRNGLFVSGLFLVVVLPAVCFGMTADVLKKTLDQGVRVTIIDVRNNRDYSSGHIPNAINIPARIIGMKRLPPLGRVIVYGDGIDTEQTLEAVRALNEKTGIEAEVLEGGFPAWNARKFSRTGDVGITREKFQYITYKKLKATSANNPDVILVDLRSLGGEEKEKKVASRTLPHSGEELSNISEHFPGLRIITPDRRHGLPGRKAGDASIPALAVIKEKGYDGVYVLIDRGDGKAEQVARRLHAAGIRNVALLVGGEQVLQRYGQPGFKTQVKGNSF